MKLSSRHSIAAFTAFFILVAVACDSDETTVDDDATTTTTTTGGPTSTTTGMGGDGGIGGMATTTSGMGGNDVGGTGGSGGDGGVGGAGGEGGAMMGSQVAYYWGDFVTNDAFRVAAIDANGVGAALALTGFEGQTDIRSVAASPDGTKIAVSGRNMAGDGYVINIYDADGSGTPLTVADATGAANPTATFSRLSWSPDGATIAFTANLDLSSSFVLYVVPSDGSAAPTAVSPAAATNQSVEYTVWVDNAHLVFNGDVVTNNVDCIWSVDVTAVTPSPVELAPCSTFSTTQDVNPALRPMVDATGRVYFAGDYHAANQQFRVYRNTVDGMNLEQVPGTSIMVNSAEASTPTFGVSPAGDLLAFTVATDVGLYNIYVLDLAQTTANAVTSFATPPATLDRGPDINTNLWFSPDGMIVATRSDWDAPANDEFSLFVVPSDGSAAPVRIAAVAATGGDVFEAVFSQDGQWLFFRGDLVVDNDNEVYGTTDFVTADQSLASLLIQGVPASGDVAGLVQGQ
jgi:Tol biopolymer transport system component